MVKLFILSLFVAFTTAAYAQHSLADLSIDIISHPSMGKKFDVYIRKNAASIKIIFKRVDSISYSALRADKETKPLLDSFNNLNQTDTSGFTSRKITDRFASVIKKHTRYSADSVTISTKDYPDYEQLLKSILTVPEDTLTQIQKNKYRLVLDGIHFGIIVKVKDKVEKDIDVNTPTQQSHRLLRRLISETLAIYRTNRPGSSMSKTYTHGY